jgi:hypothetical protein
MSARTRLSLRASLRSAALLEAHSQSMQYLRAINPSDPIVAVPSAEQRFLEGQFFAKLRDLHDPVDRARFLQGGIEITRLIPQTNSLEIHVATLGIAPLLARGILPEWEEGDEELVNGVRGLRYRILRDRSAVEFYLLESLGVIRFVGIPVDEFVDERRIYTDSPGTCSIDSSKRLAPQELASRSMREDDHLIMSVVIRRLGLLRAFGPGSIDAWRNQPGRFSVEMMVHRFDQSRFDRLVSALQSPEFSPRLALHRSDGTGYHTYFRIEGTHLEIDLRVQPR